MARANPIPRRAVDPRREIDLDDESDEGDVERDPSKEAGDGVLTDDLGRGRHIKLLLEGRGAERTETDDEGDEL